MGLIETISAVSDKQRYSQADGCIPQRIKLCDLYEETNEKEVQDTSCRGSGGVPQL